MPVEFLSDEQATSYGQFDGVPSLAELERYFVVDDADRELIDRRRGPHNRLGFAVQLATVRFLGTFLSDPIDIPWPAVVFLARQLGVDDPSVLKRYVDREKTPLEHTWEIRETFGYTDFASRQSGLRNFLDARAWTRPERPTLLFDQAAAWLRAEKVLLPGVSVLARLVAEVRTEANDRLYSMIAARATTELERRLMALLVVADGSRSSELDRLRRAPTRASGPEMSRALSRAAEITALGVASVDVSDIPPNRLLALARYGLTSTAAMLRRAPAQRRIATLVATVRVLETSAVDDAIDVFSVLMGTKLIGPAERASAKERLRSLPQLRRASATLASAARVLLELVESDHVIDAAEAWTRVRAGVPWDRLASAVATVDDLVRDADDVDADQRVELVKRYATVRPFISVLGEVVPFGASGDGTAVLTALRGLKQLAARRRIEDDDVINEVVTGSWRRLVFANPELAPGTVDYRAYTMCVLEATHRCLRRRDVFIVNSARWADPRARLIDGPAWEQSRANVLTALRLTEPADEHLIDLAGRLDSAYLHLAHRLDSIESAGDDPAVRLEIAPDGRGRLHLNRLDAVVESKSLVELRGLIDAMMPRVDLPEVLLEVHSWTGYLTEFTHIAMSDSQSGSRMDNLAISVAAVLIAEGCNVGLAPVIKPGHLALTRSRLSHVLQNYVRNDTIAAANARLIAAQAGIEIARLWGGGLIASVDGLRFVVPVRTLDAAPNPHYFGQRRGVTWLNAINDQVAGIGAVVVTGTMRDSLHVLDVILNRDGGPAPELIATDTASYSDIVFGLFRLLGYQFSPRLADLPDQRLWRLTAPGAAAVDYGSLNALAKNSLSFRRIASHWDDMLRVAASLHTGRVASYDLLRMLGRDGNPTPLGAALADYGRAAKTLHLLAMCDPDDETYRRTVHRQLTIQESRHRLARKIFYGQRGELRQPYREGQEDQLGMLGLALNATVLWRTRYTDACLTQLRQQGHPVLEDDAARLSPLGDAHLNVLGRYTFTESATEAALRPLRDPHAPDDD